MNTAINTVANTNNELYIVTGAAGNLGSAIVRSLVSRHFSRKPVRRSSRAHFCLLHPLRCHGLREYAGGG